MHLFSRVLTQMTITLPISKSIANRVLLRAAMLGYEMDSLSHLLSNATADTMLLWQCLKTAETNRQATLDCHDSATIARFLTAYLAQKEGSDIVITGTKRLQERPMSELIEALQQCGANIAYTEQDGYLPIKIRGKQLTKQKIALLNPRSTQFVSALMLIGMEVETNICSPYIDMTAKVKQTTTPVEWEALLRESDWSAAAFWYERIAIFGGEITLKGLTDTSIQGDKIVAEIFLQIGVRTEYTDNGIIIRKESEPSASLAWNFSRCPDLYPAVFATCHELGIEMQFTGLEALPLKESNRLEAMKQMLTASHDEQLSSHNDHRIAMALCSAGYKVDDTDCIKKSYPNFLTDMLQ